MSVYHCSSFTASKKRKNWNIQHFILKSDKELSQAGSSKKEGCYFLST